MKRKISLILTAALTMSMTACSGTGETTAAESYTDTADLTGASLLDNREDYETDKL